MRIASAIVLSLMLQSVAAAAYTGTADYFVFPSSWSDATIDAGSQTFFGLGADGDIDVTVRINSDFTGDGETESTPAGWINLGHEQVGSDSIIFEFSKPIVPLVKVGTVDPEENMRVFSSSSTHDYKHISGLLPTVTPLAGGLEVTGNGFGVLTSSGEIYGSDLVFRITVTHESLEVSKFDRIQVGQIRSIPEPTSASSFFLGLVAMLSFAQKAIEIPGKISNREELRRKAPLDRLLR